LRFNYVTNNYKKEEKALAGAHVREVVTAHSKAAEEDGDETA